MFKTKKNIYILLFALCCPLIMFGQTFTYFNKQILLDGSNQLSTATIPYENGYYNVGVIGYTHSVIYFSKIDLEGNIIDFHILDNSPNITTISSGGKFIQTLDGHFAIIHPKWVTEEDVDIFLLKFTADGTILWEQQFGLDGIDGTGELIQTKDGGFFIAGFAVTTTHKEMYVIKADSIGTLEWENTYCLNTSCNALSVDETLDGGYILGGGVKIAANNYDMYVVKIDSLGNQEWEQNYGSISSDPGCQIYTLKDGNFLIEGGTKKNVVEDRHYFAKLNQSGGILWEKIYTIPDSRTIQTPLVFREDGGFIGVAYFRNNNIPTPLIMNFDAHADTLWTKAITPDPESHIYVRDIDKIEGGYVITGYKFAPVPQYGWLVTIDEEGNFCEELGCVETVVDIENTEAQRHGVFLQISPNPVREQAVIQYQIPKEGVLKVYDYQGRLMVNYQLLRVNEELVLEVGDWSSGVYLYQLEVEGERVESGKLVVE